MDKLTKGKKVACPRSLDNANLLTDFKLHFATPEEIAGPIVFLCTPLAGFITGEVFNVNGGAVLVG